MCSRHLVILCASLSVSLCAWSCSDSSIRPLDGSHLRLYYPSHLQTNVPADARVVLEINVAEDAEQAARALADAVTLSGAGGRLGLTWAGWEALYGNGSGYSGVLFDVSQAMEPGLHTVEDDDGRVCDRFIVGDDHAPVLLEVVSTNHLASERHDYTFQITFSEPIDLDETLASIIDASGSPYDLELIGIYDISRGTYTVGVPASSGFDPRDGYRLGIVRAASPISGKRASSRSAPLGITEPTLPSAGVSLLEDQGQFVFEVRPSNRSSGYVLLAPPGARPIMGFQ